MLTTTQKKTAEAVINLFETSEVLGDYSLVTLISGDTGHLTYGRSQTTLGSGNLYGLLQRYCANPGTRALTLQSPIITPDARWANRKMQGGIWVRSLLFHFLVLRK